MAKTLDSFDFGLPLGVEKYPWNEWCDGNIRVLKMYQDFSVSLKAMRSVLGAGAKRYGMKVRAKGNKKTGEVTFQMYQD